MATQLQAVEQKKIEDQMAAADKARLKEEMKGATPAGARRYPEPSMRAQALSKRGHEADQTLKPMYARRTARSTQVCSLPAVPAGDALVTDVANQLRATATEGARES